MKETRPIGFHEPTLKNTKLMTREHQVYLRKSGQGQEYEIGRVSVHFTIPKITTIKILIHEIKIKLKHSKFRVSVNKKTFLHGKVQLDFFRTRLLHFIRIFFNLVNV